MRTTTETAILQHYIILQWYFERASIFNYMHEVLLIAFDYPILKIMNCEK